MINKNLNHLIVERRQRNLDFIKQISPELVSKIEDRVLKGYTIIPRLLDDHQIDIDVDILKEGNSIVNGSVHRYAQEKYTDFIQTYRSGGVVDGIRPPMVNEYSYPRHFHQFMNSLVKLSPIKSKADWLGYPVQEPYPLLIMFGVDYGLPLLRLLNQKKVEHLVLFEPDIDKIVLSLYTVEWQELISKCQSDNVKLNLIVGCEDDQDQLIKKLYSYVIQFYPIFPNVTYYYLDGEENKIYFDKLKQHILSYLSTRGNYDDEVNQLNQALHNMIRENKFLPVELPSLDKCTVAIVGAGPSLDERVEDLLLLNNKACIVSCGSAITALYRMGIKPDIHIEWESDYRFDCEMLEYINDDDYIKSIPLIAPIHLSPYYIRQFKEHFSCFRGDGFIKSLMDCQLGLELKGINSAVTFAVTLFVKLKVENLFLFGLDCGFKETQQHHSSHSVYFDEDMDEIFKMECDYHEKHLEKIKGVNNQWVYTDSRLLTTLHNIQSTIAYTDYDLKVFNCSNGADIVGSRWLTSDDMKAVYERVVPGFEKQDISLLECLRKSCNTVRYEQYSVQKWYDEFSKLVNKCLSMFDEIDYIKLKDLSEIMSFYKRCADYINSIEEDRNVYFVKIIHSILFHLFQVVTTHTLSIVGNDKKENFSKQWKMTFIEYLSTLRDHFQALTSKDYTDPDSDPWLKKSIMDPEL